MGWAHTAPSDPGGPILRLQAAAGMRSIGKGQQAAAGPTVQAVGCGECQASWAGGRRQLGEQSDITAASR